ncbi:MAG: molecular chaperone DnaK, partial [Pseudomonadota bacterium]
AVSDLKSALEGDDKAAIEAKIKSLSEASATLAQKAYEQAAAADGEAEGASPAGDDVVDAEFEEVDEDKKSA